MKPQAHHIIMSHSESMVTSWGRDAGTFALFLALIGVGVWMESVVMQIAGLFVAIVILVSKAQNTAKKYGSPKEAIEYLKGLEEQ